jgi:hypothetical protein
MGFQSALGMTFVMALRSAMELAALCCAHQRERSVV